MSGSELTQVLVLVVFVANTLLLTALIVLKTVHRQRTKRHDERRSAYTRLISRHLTHEHCTDPITPGMAQDPAFLDALIDIRNALIGPQLDMLNQLVEDYGVARQQEDRLAAPFPLGRRLRAAVALAEIGDEPSAGMLMSHLSDPEPEIRIQAARGLGRMGWTAAIDAIAHRLGMENSWVATRFADTLIGFGRQATWPLLAYIRVNHQFEHKGPTLAIRTLGSIGDQEAVEPLMEILEGATDPEIAIAAVETLGALRSPVALGRVQEAASSTDWRIRAKAATAMAEIGEPSSASLLFELLGDNAWWVRRNAAKGLARLPGGTDHLYRAINDSDPRAADAAAEALADTGELVSARRRLEEGEPTIGDLALLGHMSEKALVSP